jgi:hypothetical protein
MSKTYFIRVRGKSQGPYSVDQLRGFVKRGQLGRLHEVSIDGATWARAVNHPELFAASEVLTAENLGLAPEPDNKSATDAVFGFPDAPAAPGKTDRQFRPTKTDAWFYMKSGAECGPVEFATLQKLTSSNQLSLQDQVWTEGMTGWAPLHTVVGPISAPAQPGTMLEDLKDLSADVRRGLFPGADGKSGEVGAEACRAIAGTRPWMLFIAIFCYLTAVAYVALGLLASSLVNGIIGLGEIIVGALWAIGATLLVICFNRFGDVLHKKRQVELERGLHALRRFWVFLGIVLIVALSLAAIFLLLLLAMGPSFVHQFPVPLR